MTPKHKRTLVRLIALVLLGLSVSSCSTLHGIGEDLSGAGRGLQKVTS